MSVNAKGLLDALKALGVVVGVLFLIFIGYAIPAGIYAWVASWFF